MHTKWALISFSLSPMYLPVRLSQKPQIHVRMEGRNGDETRVEMLQLEVE
jgi:hypothetical protein